MLIAMILIAACGAAGVAWTVADWIRDGHRRVPDRNA